MSKKPRLLPMRECHHYEHGDPSPCANDRCPRKKRCEAQRREDARIAYLDLLDTEP